MGGHGGLNILPQKRWNVYNFENREKVRRDEEAAAKEEQLKQEESRKRDSEFRVLKLRQLRGLSTSTHVDAEAEKSIDAEPEAVEAKVDSKHMNLFQGIKIFDPKQGGIDIEAKNERKEERASKKAKRDKEAPPPKVVTAEDEKYRLGYGIVGKGSKTPWYMVKPSDKEEEKDGDSDDVKVVKRSSGKKSVEELREERLKRERKEKERVNALLKEKSRRDRGFSSRR